MTKTLHSHPLPTQLYEQRLDEDTPFAEPHNHDLHLRIHVHDSPHVKGGDRLVVRCARDAEAPDSLHVVEDWREEDSDEEDDSDLREAALLEELTDDDAFMRFASRYGLGELARVRIVHDQLCVALFAEGRTWRHSAMLFIAIHDRRLILHDLRFIDGHPECVAFSPGEMWYAGASGFIDYHGPRADRRLRPPTPKGDGRVARAFYAAANGRAEEALAVLAPMAIPNLSALYAPKTTLTLFDVAAHQDDPALQNSHLVSNELPSAATHLLQHEPRFAHGVFMMQRAIRAMDSDRMRALVEAGCPWISHDDVMAALPPGLGYEEAMEALRACRVRITYRY